MSKYLWLVYERVTGQQKAINPFGEPTLEQPMPSNMRLADSRMV
ncbi:hypothetical protein [Lysinibacillus fusiformis]